MKTQEWLDQNYPDKWTKTIYLNQQLEGVLDCSEYKNLWYIFISSAVDSGKLEIKGGSYKEYEKREQKIKETQIIPCLPAQTWLDQNYRKNGTCIRKEKNWNSNELENHWDFGKTRAEITRLDIREKGLEGNCDLSDFKNCEKLDCSNNYLTNLEVNNCGKLKEINCKNNQLITLNLSNLAELETLLCSNNYLTQIVYPSNPEKITYLDIRNNHLSPSNLTIFSQMRNLRELAIGNWDKNKINQNIYNHFTGSCEPLKELDKLERLNIDNTDLDSGWEYLPDSLRYFLYDTELRPNCKLAQAKTELEKEFWIDVHEDFITFDDGDNRLLLKKEWLAAGFNKEQTKKFLEEWNSVGVRPQDGTFINWFLNFKKLELDWACENEEEFRDLRNGYEYFGTCPECQQPNTSQNWCQSCNAQHFQANFNWTSDNEGIDIFILTCQLEATSPWNILEWIPYEKFKNIEPLAQGGFGKVEKAEWKGGSIWRWNNEKKDWERNKGYWERNKGYSRYYISMTKEFKNYQTVALKTLFNSQNLNRNFLKELTFYKMFRSEVSQMVPCYGVSKDKDGNYVLVMKYMPEGNLREYMRKNYRELKFYDIRYYKSSKLLFLQQISQGLKDIHRKKLVHRDLHSGNILVDRSNCRITDLGLAQPVNEVQNEHTIYGLMPYMAPEVLMGQPYIQASDIYSLGMVMYEILTGLLPYAEQAHDTNLALMILQGIRPQFPTQVKYPQLLVDLIKRCWEQEPNNRPSTKEISEMVVKNDLYHQFQEAEDFNKTLPEEIKYPTYHSAEVWHSKPINTQQITDLLTSPGITLELDNLSIQDPQEQSSHQAQIQIPPKQ
jgi:serine/threonine protein kinase